MDELIAKCQVLGIDYINKKTNKPFGKATLVKKIADNSSSESVSKTTEEVQEVQKSIIEYKNEVIWTGVENKDYSEYENKLLNLVKKCHNILYSNGSIVGTDASNDIIKLLILRFINIIYNSEKGKVKIDELLEKESDKIKERFLPYIIDISKILKVDNGNYENEVKVYIGSFLSKILPHIFNTQDGFLNTRDEQLNIYKIITEICEVITLTNTNISDYFSTQGGNIYEYFTNNYTKGSNTSKDLGQFFTPFSLIQAILKGCGFNDLIRTLTNPELYDPCCGSGGLLCITYKENKDFINSNCIYGCEIEKKTIKYALGSFMINTNELNTNILNCNSLSKNPYVFQNKKFDIIFTNPPFGIKNNYKDKKKEFEDFKQSDYQDSDIKFEDIYPLNISDGTVMFIELVIYLLNTNGICAIILPDGKMMDSMSFYKLRKFIIDKCKILKIISVNNGAFGHTSIKTKVMIIKKQDNTDGNNSKSIEFLEIGKNCNEVKLIAIGDLNNKTLSFNLNEEKEEVIEYNDDCEIKKLGDVCEFKNGTNITKDKLIEGQYPVIGGGQKPMGYHNTYNCDENTIIISKDGSYAGYISKYNSKTFITNHGIIINNLDTIIKDYLYYYLVSIQNNIYKLQSGLGQPGIKVIDLANLEIPIPSMERQEEIVEYFDEFFKDKDMKILSNNSMNSFQLLLTKPTKFKNKLQKLYDIHDTNEQLQKSIENIKNLSKITLDVTIKNTECENKKLGEVCDINYGTRIIKKNNTIGEYPVYGSGYPTFTTNTFNREGFNILIGRFALSKDCVKLTNSKLFLNDSGLTIITKNQDKVNNKYMGYYLFINQIYIYNMANGMAQKNLDIEKFNLMEIPIPTIEKQEEIVKILDNNDMIIKSLEKMIEDNKGLMKIVF